MTKRYLTERDKDGNTVAEIARHLADIILLDRDTYGNTVATQTEIEALARYVKQILDEEEGTS